MTSISVRDYRIHNLQKEYNKYSNIFFNTQNHINKLYDKGIISINERNKELKDLKGQLKKMNDTYNDYMKNKCDSNNETDDDDLVEKLSVILDETTIKNSNCDEISNLVKEHTRINGNNNELNDIIENPLANINLELLKISLNIGFKNICDGLILIIGEDYNKLFGNDFLMHLNLFNKIFVPMKYNIKNKENMKKEYYFKKISPINEIILDNCAELHIKYKKGSIVILGYFNNDVLNVIIKTSQICNNFVYQKKKELENYISDYDSVSEKFKKLYLGNSTIRDIIVLTKEEYLNKLDIDYQKYRHLTKLTFMNQMKEFVENDTNIDNIMNMYDIIRLLLLGVEHNVNIAGLLFSLTENQKIGSEKISSIIYNNLNYTLQLRLKKSSVNIKNELEKIKTLTTDEVDLKKQVAICTNMPSYVKKACLEKLEEMKASNNEYYKQLLYVKTLLNYPWTSTNDDTMFSDLGKNNEKSKEYLNNIVKKLDEKVYGHQNTKSLIKEIIGKWLKNPSSSGSAIGLVGPPGVGKTLIAKSIGDALNIPFVQITLGGQNDGEILYGHGYTYSGSQPGMVVKKMVEAGSARCVMFFDELDKTAKKHNTNEIYNILIHMTDPNTNREFQDRFFQEIKFPLNKVIFVFSYNNSSLIEPILIDRITEISTEPYSIKDKINIAKNFTIKEMSNMVGFTEKQIAIKDDEIKHIIEEYTNEAGVRELRRKIEKIFMKLNIDRIEGNGIFKKKTKKQIVIDKKCIKSYLNKPRTNVQYIHNEPTVGKINGLYATDAGYGGIIPIEVFIKYAGNNDKFVLELTGHQGKVMKESVRSAFTTAMFHIKKNLRDKFIEENKYGLHINTPSGSVPKEGPSAGCAFATAIISRILNIPVKNDIAMTGEIELTGKVTEIGGLQYKLNGAKKAGVKIVLVSKENEEDLKKIKKDNPELFDDDFKVILVEKITDVLKHALVKFQKKMLN